MGVMFVLLATIIYALMFKFLYPVMGMPIALFEFIIIAIGGWFFGIGVGLFAALLICFTGTLLFNHFGEIFHWYEIVLFCIFEIAIGVVTAWLGSLQRKTKEQKKEALDALRLKDFAVDSSISGIAISDLDGNLTYVNYSFIKMWGYVEVKEVLAKPIIEFWKYSDQVSVMSDTLNEKGHWVGDLVGKKRDGTSFEVQLSAHLVKNDNGIPVATMVSLLDVTDRKLAEKAFRESEERYREIAGSIGDWVWEVDAEMRFIYCSDKVEDILGYRPAEILGKTPFDIAAPEEVEKLAEISTNIMAKSGQVKDLQSWYIRKDGQRVCILTNGVPILNEKGELSGYRGVGNNITERKQAEEVLRESEQRFRTLFDEAPDAIFIADLDDRIIDTNTAASKMLGYKHEEFQTMTIADLQAPEVRGKVGSIIRNELTREQYFETLDIHKNGHIIPVEVHNHRIRIEGQDIVLSVSRDTTGRKQAEKEKIKAHTIASEQAKLALVGKVAGKMAHDFNNILGIIMGNTELSLLDCKDNETRKTLELIFEQTVRGKNLTKNLVAFAKDQDPKQVFFRISEKIDLVINLMRKDLEGIELLKEENFGIPELLADPGMIEHALVNLIQNSIHAISMVEHPRILIKTYSLDNNICFEIEDNGCGIPKENLENIYEPSFTLKGTKDITGSYGRRIKGTGYGMANVKKYIEQHKGSISVKSEFGSGTKFTISLPVIKKELTNEEKIEIQKEKICFDKSILLVEDEPAISGVQYRILSQEPCNHKVDIANDGQVAFDLFERNSYDLVSLDYLLPGELNGMDVYKHIRQTNDSIPILFVSGNLDFLESIKELKQKDPCVDHVSKPCQNKDYVNSINKLMEKISTDQ